MSIAAAPPGHPSGGVQHASLTPDRAAALLAGCTSARRASELHAAALRGGVERDRAVEFRLQRAYAASGRLDLALALLRRTAHPSAVFYTSAIHAHSSRGLHLAALALLSEMLAQGLLPTAHTLSASLPACGGGGLAVGLALHGYAFKLALSGDPYVGTALLGMYARAGDAAAARALFEEMRPEPHVVSVTAMLSCYAKMGALEEARRLFDGLPSGSRDFICWNAMMDGYTQHGRPGEALRLFRRMLRSGVEPDEVSVVLALSAVAQLGTAESGRWLHSFVKSGSRRVRLNARVGTALIDMYYKCGSLEDAVSVFEGLGDDRDIVAWNAMINGYAMHGRSGKALETFGQLLRAQEGLLRPTDITFIGVLNACSHAGLVEEGRRVFESMEREYGIEPKVEHYGCMVDLLGRAGLVEEAFDLVRSMETKTMERPDAVMWASLLAACRLHNKMALGERVADYLVGNGLANSGMYVLLSNMYAAVGKWEEAGRVRRMMKASGVHKEPGCSAVEIGRQVWEFVAGDTSHPRTDEIYAKLEEVSRLVKEHGHVPHTHLVLHDLDEHAKEKALAVHSEKLAVAFGLISTPPGTTIKIVKNLRACADCHAVLKLLSKITARKIVFRDRNRFHHFVDGSCTCGDYW